MQENHLESLLKRRFLRLLPQRFRFIRSRQDPGYADAVGQSLHSRTCTAFTYLSNSPEKCLLLDIKVANILDLDAMYLKDINQHYLILISLQHWKNGAYQIPS